MSGHTQRLNGKLQKIPVSARDYHVLQNDGSEAGFAELVRLDTLVSSPGAEAKGLG